MLVNQIAVKLFAAAGTAPDEDAHIAIFHRMIRENQQHLCGKLLIDVADYQHVKDGPGVVLIGHQAHWGIGGLSGGPGLHYARKADPVGDLTGKLAEAFHDALTVAGMLEREPTSGLKIDGGRARVLFMNRLHAGNDAASMSVAQPLVESFAAKLWGGKPRVAQGTTDTRAPLTIDVTGSPATVSELLARLR